MSEGNRDRKTMEGMISKANTVLRRALDPSTIGAPKNLCEKCKGVVLLSAIEAGFIVTGNVGSGILLAKRSDGTWSVPSAVGMTGIGKFFRCET